MHRVSLIAAAALLAALPLYPQATAVVQISGGYRQPKSRPFRPRRDSSAEPPAVAGASVLVRNADTGVVFHLRFNETGYYWS